MFWTLNALRALRFWLIGKGKMDRLIGIEMDMVVLYWFFEYPLPLLAKIEGLRQYNTNVGWIELIEKVEA